MPGMSVIEASTGTNCPYLDTVNRAALDFDFDAACSVSLSKGPHIYGCLVCGKFFRGRGQNTPAFVHSVQDGHFLFVHLSRGTFHCLPDDYEVIDPSLQDISDALRPVFTEQDIARLDTIDATLGRDLFGRRFLPGFVGLNNLSKTDGINVVVQALCHVPPLRDYFLLAKELDDAPLALKKKGSVSTESTSNSSATSLHRLAKEVTLCFGDLVRKLWSNKRFKSHVDPHTLVHAIEMASRAKFKVGSQCEAGEFMTWLLNQLHLGTGGSTRPQGKRAKVTTIVERTFQGRVRITTRQASVRCKNQLQSGSQDDDRAGSDVSDNEDSNIIQEVGEESSDRVETVIQETTADTNFLLLPLEIPEKPLFRDAEGGLLIPQEPLVNVLHKYDGITYTDIVNQQTGLPCRKRYQLLHLPDYLILHLARFTNNQYQREKNPTIVAFPVKNLDLSTYVATSKTRKIEFEKELALDESEIYNMSVRI
jgi:U4/U6.U5 tri-snRNP-associated protein 2